MAGGYGGQGRSSALRNSRSPPRKDQYPATVVRTSSRSGGKPTPSGGVPSRPSPANQITEEELYEINRQTALRR